MRVKVWLIQVSLRNSADLVLKLVQERHNLHLAPSLLAARPHSLDSQPLVDSMQAVAQVASSKVPRIQALEPSEEVSLKLNQRLVQINQKLTHFLVDKLQPQHLELSQVVVASLVTMHLKAPLEVLEVLESVVKVDSSTTRVHNHSSQASHRNQVLVDQAKMVFSEPSSLLQWQLRARIQDVESTLKSMTTSSSSHHSRYSTSQSLRQSRTTRSRSQCPISQSGASVECLSSGR